MAHLVKKGPNMFKKHPLATAVGSIALASAFAGAGALPQIALAEEMGLIEEVTVTGTRIQRANLVSASPVSQLDSAQIELTGVTRMEDALVQIPGIALDQSSGQAIESNGTATLQLRNLGTTRTLVLERSPPSSCVSKQRFSSCRYQSDSWATR